MCSFLEMNTDLSCLRDQSLFFDQLACDLPVNGGASLRATVTSRFSVRIHTISNYDMVYKTEQLNQHNLCPEMSPTVPLLGSLASLIYLYNRKSRTILKIISISIYTTTEQEPSKQILRHLSS